MQTSHVCQLKSKCPAPFGEYRINACFFFVPPGATFLDKEWLLKQVETHYGKVSQ